MCAAVAAGAGDIAARMATSTISPQCLHFFAVAKIDSLQNGHSFVGVGGRFVVNHARNGLLGNRRGLTWTTSKKPLGQQLGGASDVLIASDGSIYAGLVGDLSASSWNGIYKWSVADAN